MSSTRILICCLLVALAAGCKAQNADTSPPAPLTSQQNRRIEVLLRDKFEVEPEINVTIGTPAKGDFPGYDTLPVTFSKDGQSSTVNFLLSKDGNTLVRMEKVDLSRDPATTISTEGRPVRGLPAAKVEIINFDDLECPYCARLHAQFFPTTADHYKGLVKFVYKDYPLVEIHPWAMHAAVDANCLAQLNGGAYWNFVDYVHSHVDDISGSAHDLKQAFASLDKLALTEGQAAKTDQTKLAACIEKQDETPIEASMKEGTALGVDGTPTLFVNGERVTGLESTAVLWSVIDRALKAEGVQPPPEQAENHGATAAAAPPAPRQHQ